MMNSSQTLCTGHSALQSTYPKDFNFHNAYFDAFNFQMGFFQKIINENGKRADYWYNTILLYSINVIHNHHRNEITNINLCWKSIIFYFLCNLLNVNRNTFLMLCQTRKNSINYSGAGTTSRSIMPTEHRHIDMHGSWQIHVRAVSRKIPFTLE